MPPYPGTALMQCNAHVSALHLHGHELCMDTKTGLKQALTPESISGRQSESALSL